MMTTFSGRRRRAGQVATKLLASGVAAMAAFFGLLMAAMSAHASTTFTVNQTGKNFAVWRPPKFAPAR